MCVGGLQNEEKGTIKTYEGNSINTLQMNIHRLFRIQCLLFFLMKTTKDMESIITQLNWARFQLLAVIFPHNHHHSLCTFFSDEQGPVCRVRKSLRQQRQSHFLTPAMRASLSAKYCPQAQRNGILKVLNRGYKVDVVWQSSQTLQCAQWSPNWYAI
jgi:hypothetical protein